MPSCLASILRLAMLGRSPDQALAYEPLNHRVGTRAKQWVFHIERVNAYDAQLKAWMARVRGLATKNLSNILAGAARCPRRAAIASAPSCLTKHIERSPHLSGVSAIAFGLAPAPIWDNVVETVKRTLRESARPGGGGPAAAG